MRIKVADYKETSIVLPETLFPFIECESEILSSIIQDNFIKDYKKLYQNLLRLPEKSRKQLKKWEILCLSGEPFAIERAIFYHDLTSQTKGQSFSRNALHYAALSGSVEAIKFVIEKLRIPVTGLDDNGRNILHYAAWSGSVEAMKYAIEILKQNQISITSTNNNGANLLHFAAMSGSVKAIEYAIDILTKENIPITITDSDGRSMLHFGAWSGSEEAVRYIQSVNHKMDLKLDPHLKDGEGHDVFWYARESAIIQAILEIPAQNIINLKDSEHYQSLLTKYIDKINKCREPEVKKQLIKNLEVIEKSTLHSPAEDRHKAKMIIIEYYCAYASDETTMLLLLRHCIEACEITQHLQHEGDASFHLKRYQGLFHHYAAQLISRPHQKELMLTIAKELGEKIDQKHSTQYKPVEEVKYIYKELISIYFKEPNSILAIATQLLNQNSTEIVALIAEVFTPKPFTILSKHPLMVQLLTVRIFENASKIPDAIMDQIIEQLYPFQANLHFLDLACDYYYKKGSSLAQKFDDLYREMYRFPNIIIKYCGDEALKAKQGLEIDGSAIIQSLDDLSKKHDDVAIDTYLEIAETKLIAHWKVIESNPHMGKWIGNLIDNLFKNFPSKLVPLQRKLIDLIKTSKQDNPKILSKIYHELLETSNLDLREPQHTNLAREARNYLNSDYKLKAQVIHTEKSNPHSQEFSIELIREGYLPYFAKTVLDRRFSSTQTDLYICAAFLILRGPALKQAQDKFNFFKEDMKQIDPATEKAMDFINKQRHGKYAHLAEQYFQLINKVRSLKDGVINPHAILCEHFSSSAPIDPNFLTGAKKALGFEKDDKGWELWIKRMKKINTRPKTESYSTLTSKKWASVYPSLSASDYPHDSKIEPKAISAPPPLASAPSFVGEEKIGAALTEPAQDIDVPQRSIESDEPITAPAIGQETGKAPRTLQTIQETGLEIAPSSPGRSQSLATGTGKADRNAELEAQVERQAKLIGELQKQIQQLSALQQAPKKVADAPTSDPKDERSILTSYFF